MNVKKTILKNTMGSSFEMVTNQPSIAITMLNMPKWTSNEFERYATGLKVCI